MVESEAKELPEDVMLGAVMFGHRGFQPVIDAIIQLAEKCAKEPRDFQPEDHSELYDAVNAAWSAKIWREAYKITDKMERQDAIVGKAKDKVMALLPGRRGNPAWTETQVKTVFKSKLAKVVRGNILEDQEPHRWP
jgi:polyribonucleotide nucleotidyltransferase